MNRAISLSRGYRAACHLPAHYQNRVYDGLLSSAGPTGIAGNQEHLYVSASSPRVAGRGVPAQTGVCAFLIFVWLNAFVKRLYLFKAYCVGMCVCVWHKGGPSEKSYSSAAWQTLHTSLASERSQSPAADPPLRLPAYSTQHP